MPQDRTQDWCANGSVEFAKGPREESKVIAVLAQPAPGQILVLVWSRLFLLQNPLKRLVEPFGQIEGKLGVGLPAQGRRLGPFEDLREIGRPAPTDVSIVAVELGKELRRLAVALNHQR